MLIRLGVARQWLACPVRYFCWDFTVHGEGVFRSPPIMLTATGRSLLV
jgi:hypothetical protein